MTGGRNGSITATPERSPEERTITLPNSTSSTAKSEGAETAANARSIQRIRAHRASVTSRDWHQLFRSFAAGTNCADAIEAWRCNRVPSDTRLFEVAERDSVSRRQLRQG